MHKLYEYACNELKDLERKADEKGLSMADVEYERHLSPEGMALSAHSDASL